MATTCIHGFNPPDCLICRTLGTSPQPAAGARSVEVPRQIQQSPPDVRRFATGAEVVHPSPTSTPRHRRSLGGSVMLVVAALVALGAAAWILAGVVFTLLHLLELIAVGAGAGWVGYKVGHFRGSRSRRDRQ
ncbi:MAG TPA: hypothetical protein VFZ97_04380 [Acidimicrobiales bacterium]